MIYKANKNVKEAFLFGHNLGGLIAIRYAEIRPENLKMHIMRYLKTQSWERSFIKL